MEQNQKRMNLSSKIINIALLYLPLGSIFFAAIFIGDSTSMTIGGPAPNNLITQYVVFPAISFIFCFLQTQVRFRFFWLSCLLPAILGGFIPSTMLDSPNFDYLYATILLAVSFSGIVIGWLKEKAFRREKGKIKVFLIYLIPGFLLIPIFLSTFLTLTFIAGFISVQLGIQRIWVVPLTLVALSFGLTLPIFLGSIFMMTGLPFLIYYPLVVVMAILGSVAGISVKATQLAV